jgi:formate hydrogenlyase transcriptional activator
VHLALQHCDLSTGAVPEAVLTRASNCDAPLGELRKTNADKAIHAALEQDEHIVRDSTDWRNDKGRVSEEYARRQHDEIVRVLSACKGCVGAADGAAARLGMNRTTFLSRMKKFGIYAKQLCLTCSPPPYPSLHL